MWHFMGARVLTTKFCFDIPLLNIPFDTAVFLNGVKQIESFREKSGEDIWTWENKNKGEKTEGGGNTWTKCVAPRWETRT
jgi:hypothetical protein